MAIFDLCYIRPYNCIRFLPVLNSPRCNSDKRVVPFFFTFYKNWNTFEKANKQSTGVKGGNIRREQKFACIHAYYFGHFAQYCWEPEAKRERLF